MSRDPRFAGKEQLDAFNREPLRPAPSHAPFQPQSPASQDAAKRMTQGPAFHGNRQAILKEIARANNNGGITRKQLAEKLFGGFQNYVTGPVAVLMEENYVYEDPARDRHGQIMTRFDKKSGKNVIIPRRIGGSAVLLLTPLGKAAAA